MMRFNDLTHRCKDAKKSSIRHVCSIALVVVAFIAQQASAAPGIFVRVNLVGYQPSDPKVAIAFATGPLASKFEVVDAATGEVVFERKSRLLDEKWGAFDRHAELDFSALRRSGKYFVRVNDVKSPTFAIDSEAYAELPDQLLEFMRQQRCGFNPWVDAVCHSFDGRSVDGPLPAGSYVDARGGWHDAGDQLKYLLTSSNATAQMLLAYQLGGSI